MAGFDNCRPLQYFPDEDTDECILHILLVSNSQKFLDDLQSSLFSTREVQQEKRRYYLKVHTCKNIVDAVVLKPANFAVDFIVFILDLENFNCLYEVKNNWKNLDIIFSREKICLVSPVPYFDFAVVKPDEVVDFAVQHQFNIINGNIKTPTGIFDLSKRILNLAELSCGVINGIPLVGIV